MPDTPDLIVRGQTVRFTTDGLARLNDVWSAAGSPKNRTPSDWLRLPTSNRFRDAVLEKITGKSRDWTNTEVRSVVYFKRGIGTFADVRLALAYAEYLDQRLAVEVREVFLRFKGADPVLADELLERATPEANEWVARRAMGRSVRNMYTSELGKRGVADGREYAFCTNATYQNLFGANAAELKQVKDLPAKANLRDNLSITELAFLAASEALSVERMSEEDSFGFVECRSATALSAKAIKSAIDADRRSRRRA